MHSTQRIEINALLENAAWGLLQKSVILLSALAVIFDGMDIQMMGYAIPSIAAEWGVARSSFAPILAFGLLGVAIGTAFGGIVGDRVGRKRAPISSVVVFGAATLGVAFAHSISALFVLRLIAGLGIGGALPNATTLTAEFTPARRRPLAVTLSIVCIPLGGVIAGAIASHVLVTGTWRTLFWIGGFSPLLLALLLIAVLPESPRFLIRQAGRSNQVVTLLHKMGIPVEARAEFYEHVEEDTGSYSKLFEIFGPGRLQDTVLLWSAFFFTLVAIYLVFNWLPSMLTLMGWISKPRAKDWPSITSVESSGHWPSLGGSIELAPASLCS